MTHLKLRGLTVAAILVLHSESPTLADTVTLSAGASGTIQITGEVIDYTGDKITIQQQSGNQRAYDAQRVAHIDTHWPEGWGEAQAALTAGAYPQAAELFAAAARAEQRPWVRRLAMQHLMHCYAAAGDATTAGRLLVELVRSDPDTPALDEAPLAWFADDSVAPATVDQWLADRDSPAAQLLGASHALATAGRSTALGTLKSLRKSPAERIAWLAELQSWRAEVPTAKADDVQRIERRLRDAPESLQAGGWLVLGDMRRQLKQYDAAALAYLRAEMLASHQPQLAAYSLWQASQVLRLEGRQQEATKLAEQLVSEYPKTAPARQARSVLQSAD